MQGFSGSVYDQASKNKLNRAEERKGRFLNDGDMLARIAWLLIVGWWLMIGILNHPFIKSIVCKCKLIR